MVMMFIILMIDVIVTKVNQMISILRFTTSQEYTAETYFSLLGPLTKSRHLGKR